MGNNSLFPSDCSSLTFTENLIDNSYSSRDQEEDSLRGRRMAEDEYKLGSLSSTSNVMWCEVLPPFLKLSVGKRGKWERERIYLIFGFLWLSFDSRWCYQ